MHYIIDIKNRTVYLKQYGQKYNYYFLFYFSKFFI